MNQEEQRVADMLMSRVAGFLRINEMMEIERGQLQLQPNYEYECITYHTTDKVVNIHVTDVGSHFDVDVALDSHAGSIDVGQLVAFGESACATSFRIQAAGDYDGESSLVLEMRVEKCILEGG